MGKIMTQIESDTVNQHIGMKLRAVRLQQGYSQKALADHLGVTFQQIQKYEKGANRISASMLQRIAAFYTIPISVFYNDASEDAASLRLVSDFARIPMPLLKEVALRQVKLLAEMPRSCKSARQQP